MKIINVMLIVYLFMFLISGCMDEKIKNQSVVVTEKHKGDEHGETISLKEETLKEFGIEIKVAGKGIIKNHLDLTGEIKAEPSRISHIIPRFQGIVKEVYKTVGDKVTKDETLALIESNESLVPYAVKSLLNGTIIEMHMAQGELIGNEVHAFTVADLNKVWANINIYQKDIGKIKVGQKAKVTSGSNGNDETCSISFVSPIVDEITRTASARVILNNSTGKWMPGMFVTAKVFVSEKKYPIVIDKKALQKLEEKDVVFIMNSEGEFKPQIVQTGNENDENIEIIKGLNAGAKYAAKNSFIIKAEILKKSFGGGHGH